MPSGCPCPGEIIICECTAVAGTQTIVWSGSIFDVGEESCTHIAVLSDRVTGQCKGVVAYGYSAPDGHFVSRMNFTANRWHNGRTVQCRIDHGDRRPQTLIGNITVKTVPGKD